MNKRGISGPVAMVLIVLMVVAAVGIVWIVVLPMIREGIDGENLDAGLSIETEGGYTYFDEASSVACVQVRRTKDEGELIGIGVKFSFGGTSYEGRFESENIPKVNEARTQCFNLSDFAEYGAPESISVVPIFNRDGREIVSDVVSSISGSKIRKGNYSPSSGGGVSPPRVNRCSAGEVWNGTVCVTPAIVECTIDATCVGGNECTTGKCVEGSCSYPAILDETECTGGSCFSGTCVPIGAIPISACNIELNQSGQEYILVADLVSEGTCFNISRDGITLDFNGFNITGEGWGKGVFVGNIEDTIIMGGKIFGFSNGIYLEESSSSQIIDMVIRDQTSSGVYLFESSNNRLINVDTSSNKAGITLMRSSNNFLKSVISNLNGLSGITIQSGSGNEIRDTITNLNGALHSNGKGINLQTSHDNIFSNITTNYNQGSESDGILLTSSKRNNFTDINASYNGIGSATGIYLYGESDFNILTRVTASYNAKYGIRLEGRGSPSTGIQGNQIIDSVMCKNKGDADISCNIFFSQESHGGSGNKFFNKAANCGAWIDNGSTSCVSEIAITDCQGLQDMRNGLYENYYLDRDIDCGGFDFGDGKGFMPVGENLANSFVGGFDGRFNKISNLNINRPDREYVGLFGSVAVWGGRGDRFFGNVEMVDVNIVGGDHTGAFMGSVSGELLNVSKIYVNGTVSGNYWVGGLFGAIQGIDLKNVYSFADVVGHTNVGGIVGTSGTETFRNSYSVASVRGEAEVGGVDGSQGAYMESVYSVATVNGNSEVYGISHYGFVSNCYWYDVGGDDATVCIPSFGFGCTSEGDPTQFYYSSHQVYNGNVNPWDFGSIWEERFENYPKIRGFD
jgi:parallel beta-helix repeat protein